MRPFRSAGGKTWKLRIYDAAGKPHDVTTGTRDLGTAKAMARAVERLRERKRYAALYEALCTRGVTVEEVWLADERGEMDVLLARLNDVDLEPLVAKFHESLKGKVSDDTRDHYKAAVRLLLAEGKPFPRSRLTEDALAEWVDGMDDVKPGTVRKRGMGMRRFCEWLVKPRGLLERNPMDRVELPPKGDARCLYLDTPEAQALADAQPGAYRLLSAFLAGTGVDVSTALRLTKRDVDPTTKEVRAAGTKTHNRDRVVRVAEWAWPYVEEAMRGKLPGARLFDGIPDRWRARDRHVDAIAALEQGHPVYTGYTMRDHRHTWAVRAVRSGWPLEAVARQLGHANGVLVLRVYGRFQPVSAERDKWEAMATARDKALAEARG